MDLSHRESSTRILAPLSDPDFVRVTTMARTASGISLHEGKRALVSSRLEKLVRGNGFESFSSYVTFLWQKKSGPQFTEFIDTLTTNHTGFWREPEHFMFFMKTILPLHPARLRVWSAACATGEEPYTIALCALESGMKNCRVTASDISRTALAKAVRGTYEAVRVRELPAGWPEKHFTTNEGGLKAVKGSLRSMVEFGALNLLQPFAHMGSFDVIFCRNVMIYFDQQTRDDLVAHLAAQIAPGGYLFTGHSETLLKLPGGLQYVQPAIYRKP
jgi:chemotaxis protein methyltransferase CheR